MIITFPETIALANANQLWRETLPAVLLLKKGESLTLNASATHRCCGAGEAFLVEVYRRSIMQGFTIESQDPNHVISHIFEFYDPANFVAESKAAEHPNASALVQIGVASSRIYKDLLNQLSFLGEVTASFFRVVVRPDRLRLRDTMLQFERTSVDALPIVLLIGLLMGLILAFVGASTLSVFGAEIFVANMITTALFREMGALFTAILLAGRTGSAFAAELGTMQTNEEIDALITFNLKPVRFLALPRIIAITLATPFLSMFSVFSGLIGGMIALYFMGIPIVTFWQHVLSIATFTNLSLGLIKALVFGWLIGLVGCAHGLQTERTADAVGRAATAAVVGSMVMITLADGIFAIICHILWI